MFVNGEIELPKSTTTTSTKTTTASATSTTKPSPAESNTDTMTTIQPDVESADKSEAEMTTDSVDQNNATTTGNVTTTKATGPAILFSCNFEVIF